MDPVISLVRFLLLVSAFCGSYGAYCHGKPDPNAAPNTFGYVEASPKLIGSTTNGELYVAGPSNQEFYLVHVSGDPYEMGFAQGELLGNIAQEFIDQVFEYLISQVPMSSIAPDLINMTIEEALDLTADLTRRFTPDYWFEEMRGLSDASGVDYQRILQLHMLPELTKGSCSMFGAWGNATISKNGDLLQLRALDWDTDGPFKDYPAIVVYHPSDGNAFANVGFTGVYCYLLFLFYFIFVLFVCIYFLCVLFILFVLISFFFCVHFILALFFLKTKTSKKKKTKM